MNRVSGKCPVVFALDVIGDKWSLVILRDMLFRGKRTYGDFLKSHEKISTNILADRLEKLDAAGLIAKVPTRANSPRKAYELTAKGADMLPVILEMIAWSAKYDSYPDGTALIAGAPDDLLHRIKTDRDGLMADLRAALR
ncbi:winged helix-turn-helix transcriptional regulator [Octadecabacter sp. R77987]|uniref:winged helix-turn-helix transcriptional regulator n=1 Tax=Octadecabacter sp. R77987 TaxID=3093874 RepID=UPI00366A55B0